MRASTAAVVVAAVVVTAASFVVHSPQVEGLVPWGFWYSDIVSLFHSIFLVPARAYASGHHVAALLEEGVAIEVVFVDPVEARWFSRESLGDFLSGRRCPLPYLDYKMEYPPIVGALWALSVCLPLSLLPGSSTGAAALPQLLAHHYAVQGAAIAAAFLASVAIALRLSTELGASWRRVLFFVLLPSTTLYLVYNYDSLALVFLLLSVYAFIRGRAFVAGLALGLAASAKVLPVVVGVPLLTTLVLGRMYAKVVAFLVGGAVGLTPYLVLLALAPDGLLWSINYVAGWFCENCIYELFVPDVYSPAIKYASAVMIAVGAVVASVVAVKRKDVATVVALGALGAVLFNYIFTPQMMLLVTPLLALTVPARWLAAVALADIFNFAIVPTIGALDQAVELLRSLGLQAVPLPFHPASPVQLVASLRNVTLLALYVWEVTRLLGREGGASSTIRGPSARPA